MGSSRNAKLRVKAELKGAPKTSKKGLARHFDGWQPGLIAVVIAASAAILAVPRAVDPHEVPPPPIRHAALAETIARDRERAEKAAREGLHLDVREVGSAVRAYGRAAYADDEAGVTRAKIDAARALGLPEATDEGLLRLRAYQLESFLGEVRRWELTGDESDELIALAGGFTSMLAQNGWLDVERRRPLMSEAVLRASFKKRWSEATGKRGAAFELTLDEHRALVGFFLEHPVTRRVSLESTPPGLRELAESSLDDQFRLEKIDELGGFDPEYPADLARGVVLYRLGRYGLSVESFRRHLDVRPDGPYALRARNYLRAALERGGSDEP